VKVFSIKLKLENPQAESLSGALMLLHDNKEGRIF
jgi:hypothetical protein